MATDPFAAQTPDQLRQQSQEYTWHREQARRANDIVRVSNPTHLTIKGAQFEYPHGDYYVEWDRFQHRVPVNGTLDTPRYIAVTYCREMCTAIINYLGEQIGTKLLEKAGKEKPDILLDKYLENKVVWDKVPRTDDKALMTEIWPQLWLGVVKEFGLDNVVNTDPRFGEVDLKTNEEKILENLQNKRVVDTFVEEVAETGALVPVVEAKKDKAELVKEVSSE